MNLHKIFIYGFLIFFALGTCGCASSKSLSLMPLPGRSQSLYQANDQSKKILISKGLRSHISIDTEFLNSKDLAFHIGVNNLSDDDMWLEADKVNAFAVDFDQTKEALLKYDKEEYANKILDGHRNSTLLKGLGIGALMAIKHIGGVAAYIPDQLVSAATMQQAKAANKQDWNRLSQQGQNLLHQTLIRPGGIAGGMVVFEAINMPYYEIQIQVGSETHKIFFENSEHRSLVKKDATS